MSEKPVSLKEAADRLGVAVITARRYVSSGELPAVRVGKKLLKVRPADIEAFMTPVGGGA